MKTLFKTICRKIGNSEKCGNVYAKMVAQYRTPERFYHTFDGHVLACTKEFETIPANLVQDKDAVIMALFFHDVVMEFAKAGNEERSTEFAVEMCRELEIPERFCERVAELILATKHNATPVNDQDAQVVIDIDLAILGKDKKTFDEFEAIIRKEYAFVPEDVFRRERAKILQSFLTRPSIYMTDYFRNKYEAKARKNLAHSIKKLTK